MRQTAFLTGLLLSLAGCETAFTPHEPAGLAPGADAPLQCVPYARGHSQVKLYGDAYTWWDKAAGLFARRAAPREGSVMVLTNYAGPDRAHLAVVRRLVSAREIRIDHANWLNDGAIYVNDPVMDISARNDWSLVRVWNISTGGWGARSYPVQGFIGPDPGDTPRVAEGMPQRTLGAP